MQACGTKFHITFNHRLASYVLPKFLDEVYVAEDLGYSEGMQKLTLHLWVLFVKKINDTFS